MSIWGTLKRILAIGQAMGEITEGVNWLAVGVGTMVSFLLAWFLLGPMRIGAVLALQVVATFLLAWIIGICETRQGFFEAVLVVVAITVFLAGDGVRTGKSSAGIVRDGGLVLTMGVVMVLAQVIF